MSLLIPATVVMAAWPDAVALGEADVDGFTTEWDVSGELSPDFYAWLYEAGNPDKPKFAQLYMRYHCPTETVYALVLAMPGYTPDEDPSEAWIKVYDLGSDPVVDGNSGDDGVPPDFQWVFDGTDLLGYEASFILSGEGWYSFEAHINVDGGDTASTGRPPIELLIDCPGSQFIELASFGAAGFGNAIQLTWATYAEYDTLGFNIYRAESLAGLRTKVNSALIPSQSMGGPIGATYHFVDSSVRYGVTYYYWLVDVDAFGVATEHDPVTAWTGYAARITFFRPRLATRR
jgi:hypothetical protein